MKRADDALQPPTTHAGEAEVQEFFEAVLVDYILRCENGEAPDVDEYLARYPRYAEDLAFLLSQHGAPPQLVIDPSTGAREKARGWPLRKIGRYEVEFKVAATGGGTVYKARRDDGVAVALKVFGKKDTLDDREIERFKREAGMLEDVDDPRIMRVLELQEHDDVWLIAMPWIEGATLAEIIAAMRGEPLNLPAGLTDLDWHARAEVIAKTARALELIHEHGFLHRDIKPSNVMLGSDLEPVVIDFGIARDLSASRLTKTYDAPLGTPRYLAPDLLMGDAKAADVRTDVYALGMTLYELLTCQPAFAGEDRKTLYRQILEGDARAPHEVHASIPKRLSRVVMKSIATDPRARHATMRELADDIERCLAPAAGRLGLWFGIAAGVAVLTLAWFVLT